MDWSSDRLKGWIKKFIDKDLVFIEDIRTINTAKEQRSISEWLILKDYIIDKDFRIQFQLGLTLRKLKSPQRIENLREKIRNKYGLEGLHVAQSVQAGVFIRYVAIILEQDITPQRLKLEINNLFKNIEKSVVFVKTSDDLEQKSAEIITKILANSPKTLSVCSHGSAQKVCAKIMEKVMEKIKNYDQETCDAKTKCIYFLKKKDDEMQTED